MEAFRSSQNPLIEPKDIKPTRSDFEVIGVFNAGVARLRNEIILLLRVAERPINNRPNTLLTAVYDTNDNEFVVKEFSKNDPDNNYADPRLIITPKQTFLTSFSHLRLARSKDGISFNVDDFIVLAFF